ncbi:uncharacterized protein [Clytia hemisphaerica]|uniref:uncharacterized protein isoform X2 n=1 Tax=Clytia hemisphaerica TaxID=252671 RepID=UPI0034D79624
MQKINTPASNSIAPCDQQNAKSEASLLKLRKHALVSVKTSTTPASSGSVTTGGSSSAHKSYSSSIRKSSSERSQPVPKKTKRKLSKSKMKTRQRHTGNGDKESDMISKLVLNAPPNRLPDQTPVKDSYASKTPLDFEDSGLRWDSPCDNMLDEIRRIEAYKTNRRLRYMNANNMKIAELTIQEKKL